MGFDRHHESRVFRCLTCLLIALSITACVSNRQRCNPIDTNGDGLLTSDEQWRYWKVAVKDTNGDGEVSYEEELPFWKVRYEFQEWRNPDPVIHQEFLLESEYLSEWGLHGSPGKNRPDNGCRLQNTHLSNDAEGVHVMVSIFNVDSVIEAEEKMLWQLGNAFSYVSQVWDKTEIGVAGFQYVEDDAIYICFLQDNVIGHVVYGLSGDASKASTRDLMAEYHLPAARHIAERIVALIRETPARNTDQR